MKTVMENAKKNRNKTADEYRINKEMENRDKQKL
jgi:hypothetical protein